MRIAVFGTGGVGGYFGARLARAGEEVTFLARGAHLQAIQANGLKVESPAGELTVRPTRATDDPAEVGPVDLVLVAVKAWQVPDAANALGPMVHDETVVLPLQNGVEAPRQLADAWGEKHVVGGLCKIISFIARPGVVRHTGVEPYIALGELDRARSGRVDEIRRTLEQADLQVEVPHDIWSALWEKFLFVVPWGGMGALTRAPIGVVREHAGTRDMLHRAVDEIAEVARARGVELPDEATSRARTAHDGLPHGGTASLQRDLIEGRPSELEAWNGSVVRLGAEAGVDTPVHAHIYHALLPQERRARGELSF